MDKGVCHILHRAQVSRMHFSSIYLGGRIMKFLLAFIHMTRRIGIETMPEIVQTSNLEE